MAKIPVCLLSTSKWCKIHKHLTSSCLALIGLGGIGLSYVSLDSWFWVMLYIVAIILPVILGMGGHIDFKWVILWECILFLPIGLIVFMFFGGALLGLLKRS